MEEQRAHLCKYRWSWTLSISATEHSHGPYTHGIRNASIALLPARPTAHDDNDDDEVSGK